MDVVGVKSENLVSKRLLKELSGLEIVLGFEFRLGLEIVLGLEFGLGLVCKLSGLLMLYWSFNTVSGDILSFVECIVSINVTLLSWLVTLFSCFVSSFL